MHTVSIATMGVVHGVGCPKCRKLTQAIHEIEGSELQLSGDNLLVLLTA